MEGVDKVRVMNIEKWAIKNNRLLEQLTRDMKKVKFKLDIK